MIGDVLTSSILFEALKNKTPSAELHYLIHKHTFPVVENNPFIDKCILFDPFNDEKPGHFLSFLKKIRKEKYDLIIDVYSKINSAVITRFSGAKTRISYHKNYTSFAYTKTFEPKKVPETNAGLAIENRILLLQGISSDFPLEIKPKIYLTDAEKSIAKQNLKQAGISKEKPLFMIGILGSSPQKTYPLPYMASILDFVVEKTKAQLLFNYMPKQQKEAKELVKLCHPKTQKHIFLDVFGKDLREFMATTSYCDALIGNEGGAINMAKALDVPTFSIFSPWIKKGNWGIYEDGKHHISVHLEDYKPKIFNGISKKELVKQSSQLYDLMKPNLIFATLENFLSWNLNTENSEKTEKK